MSRVAAASWRLSPNFLPFLAVFLVTGIGLFTGWLYAPLAVFAFVVAGYIISLCLHEASHALFAYWGGDRSVKDRGYLSLDPLAYSHPLMTFGLPLLFLLLGGLGLPGGAVYINRSVLRSRHWDALMSAAGPLANLVCLVVLSLPFLIGLPDTMGTGPFWAGLAFLAALQASAVVLNLIPIPGFDGFGIIRPYLPYEMQAQSDRLAALVGFVVLFLFMSRPVSMAVWNAVLSLTGLVGLDPALIFAGMRMFLFWR